MKNLLKLEEFLLFGPALYLFSILDYGWGSYALLFFAPVLPAKSAGTGVSMLGYPANPRLSAWIYNPIHHKGPGVVL